MKRQNFARFFLLIFTASMFNGCVPSDYRSASETLLDNISRRLSDKNLVDPDNMGFVNPYEHVGLKSLQVLEKVKETLAEHKNSLPETPLNTFGIEDESVLELMKGLGPRIFSDANLEYSNSVLEEVNGKLNEYAFASSGVLSLLEEAENRGSLTLLQRRVLEIELQEFVSAKTSHRVRSFAQQ